MHRFVHRWMDAGGRGPSAASARAGYQRREAGLVDNGILLALACIVVIIAGLIFIVRAL